MDDQVVLRELINKFFAKEVKWSSTLADYLILHGVTIKKRSCIECGSPTTPGAILCPRCLEDQ